jgi:EAL domain-containing protein (putative c-di-GMP-specific phosphodiesterase class I)/GGDEF domain-containing protein
MSIIKELWLAITVILVVAIVGSISIYGVTTKQYVEEQLYSKNIDNATMLALTLSRLEKDPASLDLFVMSQFDLGHYARITLKNANGDTISDYHQPIQFTTDTPRWFAKFFSPRVAPGVAQISEGWGQYGTVFVESDTSFTLISMWRATYRLAIGLLIIAVLAGVAGGWFLRVILRPLDDVVHQAEAFQAMRFIKLKVPRTLELKRVVNAMNFLAHKSKKVMEEENYRLDLMRYKTQFDDESGLANRDYFILMLKGQLAFRDTQGTNCIFLIRFTVEQGFLRIPATERKTRLRELASAINKVLQVNHHSFTDSRVARLQKNEFVVLLTETHDASIIAYALHNVCTEIFCNQNDPEIFQSVVKLRPDDSFSSVLMRSDAMVNEAQSLEMAFPSIESELMRNEPIEEEKAWAEALTSAIDNSKVETFNYPILNMDRQVIHYQSWAGVNINGELHQSGYYTHWARYLGLLPKLELTTITFLIKYINSTKTQSKFAFLCSEQFLLDNEILAQLYYQLNGNPNAANHLCFEVRESTATRFPEAFKLFCNTLKAKQCEVGLKRVGESFSQLINIQELGLDYVKIDSGYMADIENNLANHSFLRGFCSLAHTFGIKVYADGVKRSDYQELFTELGIDGVVSHIEVIEHLLDD